MHSLQGHGHYTREVGIAQFMKLATKKTCIQMRLLDHE